MKEIQGFNSRACRHNLTDYAQNNNRTSKEKNAHQGKPYWHRSEPRFIFGARFHIPGPVYEQERQDHERYNKQNVREYVEYVHWISRSASRLKTKAVERLS